MPDAFTVEESRAAWDEGARAWEDAIESGKDYYRLIVHGPALASACEPVQGLNVLDLGCGQGYFCRELARRGARVTGVDFSAELIASALRHNKDEPLGIDYYCIDAAEVDRQWPPGYFNMADPATVLKSAARLVRRGGRMLFSVPHPTMITPHHVWLRDEQGNKTGPLQIDRYFDTGPAMCHWVMKRLIYHWDTPYWRHTLAEWSQLTADASFLIRRLHEPRPTAGQVQEEPELQDCLWLPNFLIFDMVKPT
jgi:2-polyprenyl-3-methyl-5-hydroxy-6-metoxy-1,4-benzoquinol methylase